MKILISSLTYSLPNGVTVSIDKSANGLIKHGHQVLIIGPKYYKKKYRPEHCQVAASPISETLALLVGRKEKTFGLTAAFQIEKIAAEFKPDIYWLHTVFWASNIFERHMLRSDKIKVLSYHTLVEEYAKIYGSIIGADLMRKRSRILANKMDAIITPTQVIKRKLQQYGVVRPIYVIPTGISRPDNYFTKKELCQKFNLPTGAKVLLYVGRIAPEKNIKTLLCLFKKLKEKDSRLFLLMVGSGDLAKFKRMSREMKISDKVVFAGSFSPLETQKIYGGSDIFVFPSKSEAQGLVIGEAMIAGLPVVAFQSLIQPEIYPDTTALIAKNEAEFSAFIFDLLKDKGKREQLIKRARHFVCKNFSEERTTEKQLALFSQLYKKKEQVILK